MFYKNKFIIILALFSFSANIYADKILARTFTNDITYVKLLLKNPMTTPYQAKTNKIPFDYIKRIKVKADNKLVFDIKTSYFVSKNPLFKFKYKGIDAKNITFEYTNQNNLIKKQQRKVKHRDTDRTLFKEIKLLPNPTTYSNKFKKIKDIYGDITLIEDGIQIKAPILAENGGSIPINIRSNLKFKSISVFLQITYTSSYTSSWLTDPEDSQDLYFICQWLNTPYSIIDFDIRIKMNYGGANLIVILESEDGKFYTATQKIEVSVAGTEV